MAADDAAGGGARERRRRRSRPEPGRAGDPVVLGLVAVTALFAVVAAVVVVVGEGDRVLRLGVVAALWATLLAVAALARRSAWAGDEDPAAREETLRRTYERELAAEVEARHEYELSVRREVAAGAAEEIAGLRAELERLRTDLDQAETRTAAPALRVVGGGGAPGPVTRPTSPPRVPDGPPGIPDGPPGRREAGGPPARPSAPARSSGAGSLTDLPPGPPSGTRRLRR